MKTKEYTNGEITIVWKPELCIHAGNCVKMMPEVYHPKERPWIKPEGADTQKLINQINNCPSGELSYYKNGETSPADSSTNQSNKMTEIQIIENGPMIVKGTMEVTMPDGTKETKENRASFCRCGASSNQPYCDGTHRKLNAEKENG